MSRAQSRARRIQAVAAGGLLALAAAACNSSSTDGGGSGDGDGAGGGTLVFGASSDPKTMDGAYVSDGESLRVVRQLFETLVTTKEGSTEIEPLLAESYEPSNGGKTWTFTLKDGVNFHDGTPFNAQAVCFNFDRWYNFKGNQQSPSVSYYWQTVFGGFKTKENPDAPDTSLYASCTARDDRTAVIDLTSASATFISGLSLPAFSIASPDALQKYNADAVGGSADEPTFASDFGLRNPIGTGAFKLESFAPNDKLTIVRNDDYWGDKAKLDRVIFRPIADGPARRQALEAGEIQGYDLVAPADVEALRGAGFQILQRPAFNVGYVGFNVARPPLDNLKIRQAIAHALNRDALVRAKYPAGAEVATQFQPPEVFGHADDVTKYPYDPARARQLIAESGVANPTLEFWYPTGVSRPYMPDPAANFQAFQADLQAVGFRVVPKAAPWTPDYLAAADGGQTQLRLLGWTGDFGDPDNFVGTFFRQPQAAWGFDNPQIFTALENARVESDEARRTQLYEDANRLIMDYLPGVPYVHTKPSIAFAKDVQPFVPSPVQQEEFSTISRS